MKIVRKDSAYFIKVAVREMIRMMVKMETFSTTLRVAESMACAYYTMIRSGRVKTRELALIDDSRISKAFP